MAETNNFQKFILFLIFIVITIGVSLIYIELHNNNSIQRSKFSHEVITYFLDNKRFNDIANDIYDKKPIFKSNGGLWEESDIDDYLGYYENIDDYVQAGSLNLRDEFNNYSDDVLTAYHNKEIRAYIEQIRAKAHDNDYYVKFEEMAKMFEEMNKKAMH